MEVIMSKNEIPSFSRYESSLHSTSEWLLRSIRKGQGGSSAYFSPLLGWSKPYPETTGYLIPTLLKLHNYFNDERFLVAATSTGQWLLSIQNEDGSWPGGLYPNKKLAGSVFNTGQILKGMMALYRYYNNPDYLNAGLKGAHWLASGIDEKGLWPVGDYQAKKTPAYYTHVAWPMLEVWKETADDVIKSSAVRFLDATLLRRKDNGVFCGWGFKDEGPAFTHTIAYTLRGFQESARLLNNYDTYGRPTEQALTALLKNAELKGGAMSGEFDESMQHSSSYVCLTGNAQIAICALLLDQNDTDLRLVNTAAKLSDFICKVQQHRFLALGTRGVAGSYPLWGKYMIMRYPNWAAKYHCDALLMLIKRLRCEL